MLLLNKDKLEDALDLCENLKHNSLEGGSHSIRGETQDKIVINQTNKEQFKYSTYNG